MAPDGEGRKSILLVGEAPGETEDRKGRPFIGKAGRFLSELLQEAGIDLRKDCWIINAVSCRPPNNQTPDNKQIEACRPVVWKHIREFRPKVIITLGAVALKSLIGHRAPGKMQMSRWRGWQIPDYSNTEAWICPTLHPSFLMRNSSYQEVANIVFVQDIQEAVNCRNKPMKYLDTDSVVIEEKEALELAEDLLVNLDERKELVALDYETNMLKPHSEKSNIVTAAFSSKYGTFALESNEENDPIIEEIICHSNCMKITANMLMEIGWTTFYFDEEPGNWCWDTVLAAHVLDHRSGAANVKVQGFVNLGVEQYDKHIDKYIKGKESYSKNRIAELNIKDVLKYNAIDALVEYELALVQMDKFGFDINDLDEFGNY